MDCLFKKQHSVSSVFLLRLHNGKEAAVGAGGKDRKEP